LTRSAGSSELSKDAALAVDASASEKPSAAGPAGAGATPLSARGRESQTRASQAFGRRKMRPITMIAAIISLSNRAGRGSSASSTHS